MAKKNNCPSLQKSLAWCEGMPSHPGIRRRVYFVNKNLIVAYPKLPRDEFGRPTSAILEGNFELQADAYWQYLDVNIDKSTVTSEPQGEAPSQTQLNKATFFHNGIDEEATAAAGWLNNSDNVYIYEDMPGKFRVLGNDRYRTKTTVNQDQGQGTNAAGTTIQVEVTDEVAPPFYYGTIETEDGTVSMDADVEPKLITTGTIGVAPGSTAQIDFLPKDGKWSFTSTRPSYATVSSSGLVSGVSQGQTLINCYYDGTLIGAVTVVVDLEAGDDPGNGGEIGPGEDEPSITYFEKTAQTTTTENIPHYGENGWTYDLKEGAAELVDNGDGTFDVDSGIGNFSVICKKDGVIKEIHDYAICDSQIRFEAKDRVFLCLLPRKGWTASYEEEGIAEFDPITNIVEGLTDGQISMTLTNGEQSVSVEIIVGDPENAG